MIQRNSKNEKVTEQTLQVKFTQKSGKKKKLSRKKILLMMKSQARTSL